MFHEHLLKFGVVKNPESNVLGAFPLDARKIFAQQTVSLLLDQSVPWTELSSPSHVAFSLECIGQSFNLPVTAETQSIISGATEIYSRWLFNADGKRPKPIEGDEQQFFRNIFRHFSFLFSPKLSNERDAEMVEVHAKLCTQVLGVIRKATLELGPKKFKTETWEELVRIMLGAADMSFSGKENLWNLGGKIGTQLVQVLLEVFLVSHTKKDELWQLLKTQIVNCRERKPTIKHWSSIVIAVSKRVLRLLYGPSEGADTVSLGGSLIVTNLELKDEFVFYIWYRLVYLIGPAEGVEVPSFYLELMQGVSQLVNIYLAVGQAAEKQLRPTVLDGNSVLHVFGSFLFDGVQKQSRSGHEGGKAEAIAALCRVFAQKKQTRFLPKYIARFYQIVEAGLRDETLRPVVLVGCRTLLQTELRGCRVLVPSFLHAIDQTIKSEKSYDAKLRAACIQILSYVVCLPKHYPDLKFGVDAKSKIQTYGDLKAFLPGLFAAAAKTEEEHSNRHALMWTASVFICEHLDETSPKELVEFRHSFITQMLHFLTDPGWAIETKITLVHIIAELATLGGQVIVTKEFASSVVLQLCVFTLTGLPKKDKTQDDLLAEVIGCIQRWCLTGTWVAGDTCLRKVITLIDQALSTRPSKTADAADVLLIYLLNHLHNWPPATGPNSLSSANKETDLADPKNKKQQRLLSSYVFDSGVLSLYRHPREGTPPNSLTMVSHNVAGRHVWNFGLHFAAPAELPAEKDYAFNSKTDAPRPRPLLDAPPKEVLNIGMAAIKMDQDNIFKQCQMMVQEEAAIVKKTNYGLEAPVRCVPPTLGVLDEDTDNTTSRLWVSHFGLLSAPGIASRFPLDSEHLKTLASIDLTKEREPLAIAVVHTRRGQPAELDRPSHAFADFSSALGWKNRDDKDKRRFFNLETETTFYFLGADVPSVEEGTKPKEGEKSSRKKEAKEKDKDKAEDVPTSYDVVVTWAEECLELHDYWATRFFAGSAVNIVVLPLPSGLFHVRVYRKDDKVSSFGPLLDELVVGKDLLPLAVRQTAFHAALACKNRDPARKQPYSIRRALLGETTAKNKTKVSSEEWWAMQFPTKELEGK